jgi:imidazoleglycerol-phosphate dehydratase/histidinol-phosphatase
MKKKKRSLKKVLFIDRDGTLINEAPPTYQVDSFDKLEFYPHVFEYMRKIVKNLNYQLVMVSNQDGLGTDTFKEDTFWPVHQFVLKAFENEGIVFNKVLIDRSFPADNNANRKPGIGMLADYAGSKDYDLNNSFVIGDRITDMQFAKNLGCKGIWLKVNESLGANEVTDASTLNETIVHATRSWKDIYRFLKNSSK